MELDKNSMLYWYPKLKELGISTPKTLFVPIDQAKAVAIIDGKCDKEYVMQLLKDLKAACTLIGYPVFMRTDQCAGKHNWNDTCYIENEDKLRTNLPALLEYNEMADMMGLNYQAIAIREFLKLDYKFKAFKGMPVAREFRFFARKGKILCYHPYWPMESIEFYGQEAPPNWRNDLKDLYREPESFSEARQLVRDASAWTDEYWSIDVCYTETGEWYLTDMAIGKQSYHWEGCLHITEILGERVRP